MTATLTAFSVGFWLWLPAFPGQAENEPQDPNAEIERDVQAESQAPATDASGLWPTPRLQKLLLRRFADDVFYRFEFNEDQRQDVEEAVVTRWTEYLDGNRDRLQPLLNEYIELKMHLEPPDREEIQSWAQRAIPAFQSMKEQLQAGVGDLREIATPEQRMKLEPQSLMLDGAMLYAETRIRRWAKGDFDPSEFVEPTPSMRRQRRKERDQRKAEAAAAAAEEAGAEDKAAAEPTPPDFIAEELSLWERYVSDFIQRFDLDEGQRATARSVLREMQSRASSYRDRHKTELAELELALAASDVSEESRASVENRIRELYGPVDDMFSELKKRVDTLPTSRQRATFAEAEEQRRKQGEEATDAAGDDREKKTDPNASGEDKPESQGAKPKREEGEDR
ncbi:MAG: hypothetical protein ACYTHJ_14450 [Planctomycetota bacterium]|jgi:hypothetical protein